MRNKRLRITTLAAVASKDLLGAHQLINQTSGKVEYYTPGDIINAAKAVFRWRVIDLDPASSETANETIRARKIHTDKDDGLKHEWHGTVWMNHPFGRTTNKPWIDKLEHEFEMGRVVEACCITFACTSEAWFKPLLRRPQCFLVPRTNYLLPDGSVLRGVTKGSVVTYYGPDVRTFSDVFRTLGVVKVAYAPNGN